MKYLLPFLIACGMPPVEAPDHCTDRLRRLAVDAESPLGFSARDVLDAYAGSWEAPARWPVAGGGTSLDMRLTWDEGRIRYHDLEPRADADGSCEDFLAIEVEATFTTADGALDERFAAWLRAPSVDMVFLRASLDPDGLDGTYEVTEIEPGPGEELDLDLAATFREVGMAGDLRVQAGTRVQTILRWPEP